jgi:hypothetical protein
VKIGEHVIWNENGKRPIWQYLALTFGIAWLSDAIMILGERFGILTGDAGKTAITVMICLGVACAPAYAMLILLKKFKQVVTFKEVVKRIVHTDHVNKTDLITLAFFVELLLVKTMTSIKLVNLPWYYYLSLPLMIAALVFG